MKTLTSPLFCLWFARGRIEAITALLTMNHPALIKTKNATFLKVSDEPIYINVAHIVEITPHPERPKHTLIYPNATRHSGGVIYYESPYQIAHIINVLTLLKR